MAEGRSKLVYIASPYSSDNPNIREYRLREACLCATWLIEHGYDVFCPIAHSEPLILFAGAKSVGNYWMPLDLNILSRCDELLVLLLDGWPNSAGIAEERALAAKLHIPERFIERTGSGYALRFPDTQEAVGVMAGRCVR